MEIVYNTYMKTIKINHEHVGKYTISMDGYGFGQVFSWCILRWENHSTVTRPKAVSTQKAAASWRPRDLVKQSNGKCCHCFERHIDFFKKKQIYGIKPLYIYMYMCIVYICICYIYIWLVSPFLSNGLIVESFFSDLGQYLPSYRTPVPNKSVFGGGHHETAGCWTVESLGYRAKQYDKRTGPMHYVNLFQKTSTKNFKKWCFFSGLLSRWIKG